MMKKLSDKFSKLFTKALVNLRSQEVLISKLIGIIDDFVILWELDGSEFVKKRYYNSILDKVDSAMALKEAMNKSKE